jgi:uncharacterized protein
VSRTTLLSFALAISFACAPHTTSAATPTVRAITTFVTLDATHYEKQLADAEAGLRKAKALFEKSGYAVQTVRITTQPFMEYVGELPADQGLALLRRLDAFGNKNGVTMNIGPAVLDDHPDPKALQILEDLHAHGNALNATMIVASEAGIHWNTIKAAAHHVRVVAERSPRSQGNFSFAAVAMVAPGSPFSPVSYHLNLGGSFAIGLQSADRVAEVLARTHGDAPRAIAELSGALSEEAAEVHRIAAQIEQQTQWKYLGLDPTPAPLKDVSIAAAMEGFTGASFGSSGTMTAAYIITESQRRIPGPRVGYSGLMLPVLEDSRLAQRWNEGAITLDSLLAYSAVCGTGLDAVPLPGDVTEEQIARIIGDVAVLAYKWKKPLTARLQPVHGKRAGEMSDFDSPYMVNVRLQDVK